MDPRIERRALASKQVKDGRRTVERRRRRIEKQKARGMDTATSERLLRHFEQSQVLFEQDLADLDRNRPDGESTES